MTDMTDGIIHTMEAGTIRRTKLKQSMHIVPWAIAGFIGLCLLTIWVGSWIYSSPAANTEVAVRPAPAAAAPVQTVQRPAVNECDNIYREYHVTPQARPLLKKAGCTMGWNIQSGGLYLIDASGKVSGPFYKDSVVGVTSPAIEWRATEGGAIVKARFY